MKKITKSKLRKIIKELYGGDIANPPIMGDTESAVYNSGRIVLMGPEELEQMKKQVEPDIIGVLKDYSLNKSDAYELLALVLKDLENQLADFDYEYEETPPDNPSLNERARYPLRMRVRSSKKSKRHK